MFCGGLLAAVLQLGAANPPYAGMIVHQVSGVVDLEAVQKQSLSDSFRIVIHKTPMTVEALATTNAESAVWGFTFRAASTVILRCVLLDTQGYVSVTHTCLRPRWFPFVHVTPSANRLYLHLDGAGGLTVRINDEVVWRDPILISQTTIIDFLTYTPPAIKIHFIRVYSAP